MYGKVIQLYIHMYLFFLRVSSYIVLSRVPCAIQSVLVSALLDGSFLGWNKEVGTVRGRKKPILKDLILHILGFPGGKESACNTSGAGYLGSITGSGRSSQGGHGNPL